MTCQKSDISAPCGEPGALSDEAAATVCAAPAVKPPEPIDVYDADRRPTGLVIDRRSQGLGPGQYMLYAIVMVCDARGRMLITRRALDKAWAAGWWEVPGGGVCAGETTRQAAIREAGEEVALDLTRATLELLWSYRNDDPGFTDNYFADIYRATLDFSVGDVRLREREATEFALASWEEVQELGREGRFLHYERLARALGLEGKQCVRAVALPLT